MLVMPPYIFITFVYGSTKCLGFLIKLQVVPRGNTLSCY